MNLNHRFLLFVAAAAMLAACHPTEQGPPTLKDVVGKHFLIGAAINTDQQSGRDSIGAEVVLKNFNQVSPENCMKQEVVAPKKGEYHWEDADQYVQFAEDHQLKAIGHCLVWHAQAAPWFFTDDRGKQVSRDTLIQRMHTYISDVVGRYKGRLIGWDVINEAFEDDGSMRHTPYLDIIGPDYFELAFKFAHEADPEAELYYNDYSMAKPEKRAAVCQLVRDLKAKGCRIDGVGMQSHNGTDYPDLPEYEKTIDSLAATGVKVMITELDLNMLPNPESFGGAEVSQNFEYQEKMNPYKNGLDEEAQKLFEERYLAFFDIYSRHREQISRVTLWGVGDGTSWLNGWPIPGRTNYPLLFDRNYDTKPVVSKIIQLFEE